MKEVFARDPRPGRKRTATRRLRLESLETRRLLDAEPWLVAGAEAEDTAVMADFSLADVNPGSASFSNAVSPRDYLQQVSAWYFGHAT